MAKKNICKAVINEFGLTNDIYKAGYIMPDGTMLDFSAGGERRQVEHTAVSYFPEFKKGCDPRTKFMDKCKAIRLGALRVHPSGWAFAEMVHKPTREQFGVLEDINTKMRSMSLEATKPNCGTKCYRNRDGGDFGFVDNFVNKCFVDI